MNNAADRRLILLLGSSRSGTTWLAAILNSYPEVVYSHEPLSRLHRPQLDSLIEKIKSSGTLLRQERQELMREWSAANHECRRPPFFPKAFASTPAWLHMLAWVLVRTSGYGQGMFRRALSPSEHSPFDVLVKEIEWSKHTEMLVQALDPTLLIIMRHPCGVAASLLRGRRLGLMPSHDRALWYADHEEMCQEVGFASHAIERMESGEFLGLQWLVHNLMYRRAMQLHRDSNLVVYEDLCRDPVPSTKAVFAFLGWQLGPRTLRFIERSTKERTILFLDWLQAKHPYFGVRKDPIHSAESWRSELSQKQIEQVLSMAGRFPDFEQYWPDSSSRAAPVSTSLPLQSPADHDGPSGRNGRLVMSHAKQESPAGLSVPLVLESMAPPKSGQPVSVGLPFPRGALRSTASLRLADSGGRIVPVQTRTLSHWPDGSVCWVLLDFIFPRMDAPHDNWVLSTSSIREPISPAQVLDIQKAPGSVIVNTGVATFHLGKETLPFCHVQVRGKTMLDAASSRILLTDAKGRPVRFQVEEVVVEDRGPLRATVLIKGVTRRCRLRFSLRLCFFVGTSLVRLRLTLHNPRRARHKDGLWDLGDPGSVLFRELALELELTGLGKPEIRWSPEPGMPARSTTEQTFEIYQDSSGGENWRCKNHVNREGRVPTSFRGYRVHDGPKQMSGLRANPIVSLQGAGREMSVAVPEFWQQFPKALTVEGRRLRVGLFPGQFADLHELQGGEQKTHTIWFDFNDEETRNDSALDWVHDPLRVHAPAEWYLASGAVPRLISRESFEDRLEAILKETLDGKNSFLARREIIDEYGWRNYGDLYADHELAYYRGSLPLISHYNNQYDVLHGFILQFLLTGDKRWYELLDPLARHVIDIDIYRTQKDKSAYNGGLFWHTDHYLDAATSTHRSFSRSNRSFRPPSYGGGPSNEHNYTSGLLFYYYLTGDRNAQDAVIGLTDWVINRDDGSKSPFSAFDDTPTGLASWTAEPNYHGPGRGAANSVNALLDAWIASGQRHYLEKAEELIRRVIHPADNIEALDLLNVEHRWSYTVFLEALARYLLLKEEYVQVDFMYAYAQASLITYAKWMLQHEVPFFSKPEKLEFPTETWAAQELRKANVLRLAARHAAESWRSRLVERGEEFSERAFSDLFRFESRSSTRSVAILLSEGLLDAYLSKSRLWPAPVPSKTYDFGLPESFIPQKQRIRDQIMTIRGLARLTLRFVKLQNWWKLLRARRA